MIIATGLVSAYPHSGYTVICNVPAHMACHEGETIEIPVKIIDKYSGRVISRTEYTDAALIDVMKNEMVAESELGVNGSYVFKFTPDRKGEIPLQIEYYPDYGYVNRLNLTVHVYPKIT